MAKGRREENEGNKEKGGRIKKTEKENRRKGGGRGKKRERERI